MVIVDDGLRWSPNFSDANADGILIDLYLYLMRRENKIERIHKMRNEWVDEGARYLYKNRSITLLQDPSMDK